MTNPNLLPGQLKLLEVVKELKDLPREVLEAIDYLISGESDLEPKQFAALIGALLRAPEADDAEQIVRGIIQR